MTGKRHTGLEDPALVGAFDPCSRVWRSATDAIRVDREEEVALFSLELGRHTQEGSDGSTYHATCIRHGERTASAALVLNEEVDANVGPGFAVVCSRIVRLARPEFQAIAGPGAEVVEDYGWTFSSSSDCRQWYNGAVIPFQKVLK